MEKSPNFEGVNGTKYSRVDQVKFVEDCLYKNFTCSILEYFVPNGDDTERVEFLFKHIFT